LAQNYAADQSVGSTQMLDQNQSDNQFDLGGLKDTISKKMEDVNKALDDKDK
jgi:hypothetical protein